MTSALEHFIPQADARERHAVTVRAPVEVVSRAARSFSLMSIRPVRAIVRLRAAFLGGDPPTTSSRPLVEEALESGWGTLVDRPGELVAVGAVCEPWRANVVFRRVPADRFAAFAEPGLVRIAWTIETVPLGPALTRLATETRAAATDAAARRTFRRYWRWARFGIVAIRWLVLPAIRRRAEAEWNAASRLPSAAGPG